MRVEIVKQVIHLAESSNGLSIVSVSGGMELIYNSFFDLYRKILDDYRGGQGKGIKCNCNYKVQILDNRTDYLILTQTGYAKARNIYN